MGDTGDVSGLPDEGSGPDEVVELPGDETLRRRSRRQRLVGVFSRHPMMVTAFTIALVVGGAFAVREIKDLVDPPYRTVDRTLPAAPTLSPAAGETVYRIDASRSEASYEVGERIVGADSGTATGRTNGIAGDFAINRSNPAASRIGQIVINVEQLTSDSTLRDARIRSDFLESHQYSLARFTATELDGLPEAITEGETYPFTLSGDLEVKAVSRPVEWSATARLDGDEVVIEASTKVKMSDYGIGPITIIGLVGTDDDMTLSIKVTAVDPTQQEVPVQVAELASGASTGGESPSFANEVRPILEKNCVSCHTTGSIGADVWRLDTAGDAAQTASGIGVVTKAKYMPPWPASSAGIPLRHDRRLDAASLDVLDRWAAAGGQLDVDPSEKLTPPPPDPALTIRADVVAKMAEPYVGDGTQTNDYRCFIMDPGFTEPTYITGYSYVPQTLEVAHHALTYRVRAADRAALEEKAGADGRPGWQCFLGSQFGGAGSGDLVAGWVPGQVPLNFGSDAGFLFEPGDILVTQMHYHYGPLLPDQSELVLQTAKPSPEMRELSVRSPTGPVELPCPAAASSGPLCDRAAAVANLVPQYGPAAPFVADGLLRLCGGERGITKDPLTGNGTTTCDSRVGTDGDIVDVLGHMHEIGKSFRMTLNPDTPDEKVLLDIPTWNFDWQLNYQPIDAVPVKRGDKIRIECSWDRSLRFDPEPRYIVFAEGTEDEMCFSTYTVLPARK